VRNAARLKLGFFPLPQAEGRRLRKLVHSRHAVSVIDPCVGTGTALHLLTDGLDCNRYGVELDADRAAAATQQGIMTIQGNMFDVHAKVETFSMLYLNPPYDSEIGPMCNHRMEYLFLDHTYRWLVVGGLLVLVIPFDRLHACVSVLAANFTEIAIFKLTDPESVRFKQIAVTAVRKPVRGSVLEMNRALLQQTIYGHRPMSTLDGETIRYSLPATPATTLIHRGLPLDQIEDEIPQSQAWKQAAPFLLPKEEMASGRPITPLHGGHVGLLCTAGLLNGVFGQGSDRHIARWRSVKHTTVIHEKEENVEITRKRERFSNELSLVYQDGRTLLLTESAKKQEDETDEECTSPAGAA